LKKILIVTADYYQEIADGLKQSALKNLDNYEILNIVAPGVFEIPVIISKHIDNFDAFIALGCVIKGKTPHFDFISKSVMHGIMNLSIAHKKPIGNGVITCLNKEQALVRLNKGAEAAKAVIKVLINEPVK
jgi:6,7-dimethyl-8-ribityllumazine synthase|tara:strand:- start:181 stop:573 length:393 start_codon:yes stop_codon:yes gene_type:complete